MTAHGRKESSASAPKRDWGGFSKTQPGISLRIAKKGKSGVLRRGNSYRKKENATTSSKKKREPPIKTEKAFSSRQKKYPSKQKG